MVCNVVKVDSIGGDNEPDDIVVEASRQAEFEVQQVWRPEDKEITDADRVKID